MDILRMELPDKNALRKLAAKSANPYVDFGLPAYNTELKCPRHPEFSTHTHYGLLSGGCGYYTVCEICDTVVSKTQDPEMEDLIK